MKKLLVALSVISIARVTLGFTILTSGGCGGAWKAPDVPPASTEPGPARGGQEPVPSGLESARGASSDGSETSAEAADADVSSRFLVTTGGPGAPIETREPGPTEDGAGLTPANPGKAEAEPRPTTSKAKHTDSRTDRANEAKK